MKALAAALAILTLAAATAEAKMQIASGGKARCVIITQPGATLVERHAADELRDALQRITGAQFTITESHKAPRASIVVGPGPAAGAFRGLDLDRLGGEESVIRVSGSRMLLTGGRPRGTLYAVYRFLQDECGVRWWTPWAADYPRNPGLSLEDMKVRTKPAFESRDPFWYPAFDGDWAARNFSNSQHARLTEKHGGKIVYKGFVHTFYPLVPPEKHFATHPEWFSLIDGRRKVEGGQLCTTNPELREEVVRRVREWLKESPEARIVSISQNDWYGACQCPRCKAVDDAEGSHAGTMLSLVNYVAEKLGPEFPEVAFDTLAYQYTRQAPKSVRPRPNVIVRLCSIECDFAAPLEAPSNAKFAQDIRDWSRISNRLYVWDYTTDFAHYIQPHPNWFVLGPNVRFFHRHGVKGLFEQGAYQSFGAEMAEMRAWVLARLLYNPYQDDRKLIREFLEGYYGKASAKPIWDYLELMSREAKGFYLTCFSPTTAPFFRFDVMRQAEALWQQAEDAARSDPERLWRVRIGRLPLRYVWLTRWTQLQRECARAGAQWPLPPSRREVAREWHALAVGPGPQGWRPVTHLNEGGVTPDAFLARFGEDPPAPEPGGRPADPPKDIPGAESPRSTDAQDDLARLHGEGSLCEIRADRQASDGLAIRMPGTHREWAVQFPVSAFPKEARTGRWKVYAVVRVERNPGADGTVFTAGIYDSRARASRAEIAVAVADASESYRSHLLGTVELHPDLYVWMAPAANPGVRHVWVDRVYLVPE